MIQYNGTIENEKLIIKEKENEPSIIDKKGY